MYPANQYMDPYHSHYRNHNPYPYYPHPEWETSHPRAMDSSYRPPSYGPWSYNVGMHHPHPSDFHCGCNHTYSPGYYSFRPPFHQELPPPHLHYHGPFMQHSNSCPSHFIPPRPFPVDQMPYCYETLKYHCCGCPNHVCHGTEKSNVKIEEERPDVKPESEHKDVDSSGIIRHPNNQYPFVWLPSGNMEGKENGRIYGLPPQLLNGSTPMSSCGDVKQQKQENEKEKQFQWPIVWMPAGYDEPKQEAKESKEINESRKASEEAPRSPKIKIIPLSWFENSHNGQNPAARDGSGDHSDKSAVTCRPAITENRDGIALEGNHKTTPVVPKRVNDEGKPARENYKTSPVLPEKGIDEKVSTYRTIPVMTENESDEKKTFMCEKKEVKTTSNAGKEEENGKTNNSESSTAKHSKLPPVCLRVDPLPRKRSGNGSSRSPSPPTRKDGDDKARKEAQRQNLELKQSDIKEQTNASEVKEKSLNEMKKEMGLSNETVQATTVKHLQQKEDSVSKDEQKVQDNTSSADAQENAGAQSLQGGDGSKNEKNVIIQSGAAKDDANTCRTNLSEPNAAIRIQSAYRGYNVRRWQPLDKLQTIRDVHEKMEGVRKELQCLETSSKKPTEKEQMAIGETIMNLLLKLDTIQGLHPSVREARKSVARELICLQENLDILCKQSSGKWNHTQSVDKKPERAESVIQTAAPTLTAEASDKEVKAFGPSKAEEPSLEDSMEPLDAVQSATPMEVRQDGNASEQNNQRRESCTTAMDVAREEGFCNHVQSEKAAGQVEFQGASSMGMISDAALREYTADNQEHEIEESNAVSMEQVTTEEKPAGKVEEQEVPMVNSTEVAEPLHDAAFSGDSSELKQCTVSSELNLHADALNPGVSLAGTEDTEAIMAASLANGLVADKDGSAEHVGVESPELRHGVSPSEDNQHKESSASVVNLDDSSESLKDAEPSEDDAIRTIDSEVPNVDDQSREARDSKMHEQADGTTQDLTKEAGGMLKASKGDIEVAPAADAEKLDQAAPLELTSESNSAEQTVFLEQSDDAVQGELSVSGKGDSTHTDLMEGSASGKDPLLEASRKESHPNPGEQANNTKGETAFPESGSCELSYSNEGGITGNERPEMKVSPESQTEAQEDHACSDGLPAAFEADECTETREETQVGATQVNYVEEVGIRETDECSEMLKDASVCATEANSTENPKDDVSVQTENKASEEDLSASTDALKDSDEKRLAEENQKLKELLQKLLASDNDQMGVITDLSEKVKVLERKLARKKRPKVRVHRPSRQATAKVH